MHTYNFVGLIQRLDLDQCTLRFGNLEYASSGYDAQEEVIRRTAREVSHREDIVGVHQEVLDFVWGNWAHTPTTWRGCHNSAFVGDYGTRWDVLPEEE